MYPKIDLHMHTRYSDGRNTIDEMVRAAAANDLYMIAITDHLFRPFMRPEWLDKAREEIEEAMNKYGIHVLYGVEITKPLIEDLSKPIPVTKEVQLVVCEHPVPDHIRDRRRFLEYVLEGIKRISLNENIDVLAHPLNLGRSNVIHDFREIERDFLVEIARVLADSNIVVEVMSQMYWWYPHMSISSFTEHYVEFIKLCKHHGVLFTIGSDAHSVCGVGNVYWSLKVLKRAGVSPDEIWMPEEKKD
ncbi:MAG: hypothetical protein DRJ66_03140 [Thermoprotei archaeon]|nr:MAG: hypothetical protein DRJ66_03140 [Thermoprotei archaeon]